MYKVVKDGQYRLISNKIHLDAFLNTGWKLVVEEEKPVETAPEVQPEKVEAPKKRTRRKTNA